MSWRVENVSGIVMKELGSLKVEGGGEEEEELVHAG